MGFTAVSRWRGDSFDVITLMHPSGLVVSVMTHHGIVRLVIVRPKWMISESIRRRGISVGEVSYRGRRYPAEIIAHCVWLYHRFPLSLREVVELLLVCGVLVSSETIRQWCAKFGPAYACRLRRRRPRPGDTWHLDEVFLTSNGAGRYLWRAVDPDGNVLDILVHPGRDAKAAKRLFRNLFKRRCASFRVLVTDELRGYAVAHREVMASVEHRRSRYLNRAEDSHQPTRHRERAMKRFRPPGAAQRFLAVFSVICPHFWPRRHRLTADDYRSEMTRRFAVFNELTGLTAAA
jgi:putative transposase